VDEARQENFATSTCTAMSPSEDVTWATDYYLRLATELFFAFRFVMPDICLNELTVPAASRTALPSEATNTL
jgi:hypothetical protein